MEIMRYHISSLHGIITVKEKQAMPKVTFVFLAVQAVKLEHINEQAVCEADKRAPQGAGLRVYMV